VIGYKKCSRGLAPYNKKDPTKAIANAPAKEAADEAYT
jgi:hypothetical protein